MALVVGRLLAQLGIEDTGFSQGMQRGQAQYQATARSAQHMAAQVQQASARVQSARAAENATAVRVRAAEENLTQVRKTARAGSIELAQAEARLGTALAAQNAARVRATQATNQLAGAQRQQAAAANQSTGSTQRATQATNQLATAATIAKGALAAMGVGFGIGAVVQGMVNAVGAARSLGAQTSQLNVIFGENSGQISSWGKTAGETMRMSQREAQGAAIQFATFGKAMGLAGQNLVNFSKEQTQLAADLASFAAIPVADAIAAMGSAYAGETETLRQYGVLLDENSIKEAVYAKGLAARGAQLTAQQKAIGTYLVIQEKLAHVNGNVADTNKAFGASLKNLTWRLEETQAAVGQKLIPVIQPFVDLLAGPGLSAVQGMAGVVGAAASAFNSLPGPVQAALATIVAFRIAQRLLGDQMAGLGTRLTGLGTSFRTLGQTVNVSTSMGMVQMGRFGSAIGNMGRHVPVIARMQQSFVQAAVSAQRFPVAAGAASAAMTGLGSATRGLVGALGGPFGIAIMGATALLSMWISKKQEDAQRSQEAAARTDSYADAIANAGGAIDANVRKMVAKELVERGATARARELQLSEEELTDAVVNQDEALSSLNERLIRGGPSARFLARQVLEVAQEFDNGRQKADLMGKATGDATVNFDSSAQATKSMSEAMREYKEDTGGAASQVDKLAKALRGLADDQLTQEEADQSWHDNLRSLTKALGETSDAVVKLDGSIDVTTESGSKMQDAVIKQRDAYIGVAAAAKRYTDEQQRLGKMDAGQALDHLNKKLGPMRQSFIDAAIAAGHTAAEAEKLANKYLGLPETLNTQLELHGADAAISKLDQIKVKGAAKIEGTYHVTDNSPQVAARLKKLGVDFRIIDGKIVIDENGIVKARGALEELGVETTSLPEGFVKITDTSAENIAKLKALGIEVHTLPNGTIVINTDDADFWNRVREAQKPGEKVIRIRTIQEQQSFVDRVGQAARDQGMTVENRDGSIRSYADGAVRSRPAGVPRMPTSAVIENAGGPGLVRWAEQGAGSWEAFIPGKKTARTIAILDEAARRLGYHVIPAFADGAIMTAGQLAQAVQPLHGQTYTFGGWPPWLTDCSGGAAAGSNLALTGDPARGGRFATGSMSSVLAARGYRTGRAPAGVPALEHGWLNGGPGGGHTSSTIYDGKGGSLNFEMGGQNGGGAVGGGAVSSRDGQFTNQAWLPLQGDDDAGTTYGGLGASPGSPGSLGSGSLGSTSGDSGDTRGSGTAVYVTNWPAGYGSGNSGSVGSSGSRGSTTSPGGNRRRLFTIGGGSIYNNNPDQPGDGTETRQAKPEDLEKARKKEHEASERLRIAKMRLDEVQANPKAKPSQIAAAELAVTKATNAHAEAVERLNAAERATPGATPRQTPRIRRRNGGTIPGSGRGDIVPLMGEPGEEVIRRQVAEQPGMRRFLKAINAGGIVPEYRQNGGTVGGFSSGFGGYQPPSVAKVGLFEHTPAHWMEQLYRLGVAGYGGASMVGGAVGADGSWQGLSTGSTDIPILNDMLQKLSEVVQEGRVGSIGIYVGDGGQIVVEDMGDLRKTQDEAARDAAMRSAAMRT